MNLNIENIDLADKPLIRIRYPGGTREEAVKAAKWIIARYSELNIQVMIIPESFDLDAMTPEAVAKDFEGLINALPAAIRVQMAIDILGSANCVVKVESSVESPVSKTL